MYNSRSSALAVHVISELPLCRIVDQFMPDLKRVQLYSIQ